MMGKAAIGGVGNLWDPNAPEHTPFCNPRH